ncbi:MAG: siroheme synthase [Proteobacteria bacterium]|nr:siroheme synthase [Pseudomonadota bacterium]
MYPISLDLKQIRVGLVGRGFRAVRRLALLDAEAAGDVRVFSDAPSPELLGRAGKRLTPRLPFVEDLRRLQVLFIADLDWKTASRLAERADRIGLIVNVEDETKLSTFHSAAALRRGDFTVAISTNGKSPAMASLLRRHLEGLFGPDWERQAVAAAERRQRLKREGADGQRILAETSLLLGLPAPRHAPAPVANDNAIPAAAAQEEPRRFS